MSVERIRLIVLFGGQSAEHDVSCTTATHVLRAIDPDRYDVLPVGISREGAWSLATGVQHALRSGADALPAQLPTDGEPVSPTELVVGRSDTVVLPLLHGPLGEDGTVQGFLELVGLPYVGSGVLGSSLCMDKAMAKQVVGAAGIPQARHIALRAHEITASTSAALAADLGLPLFVKPANMGSSVGVSKAKTVDEIATALQLATAYDEWVVVEEAVVGREIEVGLLGNLEPRASVPGEIIPGAEFYDYEDKYISDVYQAVIPAPLSEHHTAEVRELAIRAYRALRCDGLARVDFFFEPGGRGFLLNEVNTMPGFTPISMFPKLWIANGMTYPQLIDELVHLAIDRHARQRRNTKR
jgi:D-alanine-D-alanine ligase